MISLDGYRDYLIWEHSATVKELYAKRCRKEAEEMTCAAQAATLLAELVTPGDELLDVGCGSGYFYHSLVTRGIPVRYWGLDAAETLIEIGKSILPEHGLDAARLLHGRIEDLGGEVDHIICMNVLSNIDNLHRPLERLFRVARKSVILRESVGEEASYSYVKDIYLDPEVDLKVHVNRYKESDIVSLGEECGFRVKPVTDERTGGEVEMIIDHPHYWKFFVATRK